MLRAQAVKALLPPLLLIALATGLFQLFFPYDWDEGVLRGGLVCGIACVMLAARRLAAKREWREWPKPLVQLAMLGIMLLLAWHFKEGLMSAHRQRHSEMGDIHVRGVALVWQGVTPWHFGTVLDEGSFKGLVAAAEVVACRTHSTTPDAARFSSVWDSARSGEELFPERIAEPECARAHELLSLTGYKYGPVMLASYVPLVTLMGRGGEYVTHLFFLMAIIAAVAVLLQKHAPEGLLMACLVLLGQSVLRRDTLLDSDCDLIPTALMMWALVAFQKTRPLAAGALVALTFASKVFPAVFLFPLLLRREYWKAMVVFALVSAMTWGPAIALDGVGVWDNVFRFNIDRPSDSTALIHFVSPTLALVVRVIALCLCAFAFWKLVIHAWQPVTFVAFSIGAFFLATKVFHNNYIVWWLPVVGVVLGEALSVRSSFFSKALVKALSLFRSGRQT